jgi:hypothetical protein
MKKQARQASSGEPDLDAFVAGLTDRVLHCRELGHVWKPLTARWDGDASCYDRRLRCNSCRTVRIQLLTRSGHPVSNRYVYPDGYLAKGTTHNANRDVFRIEAITRFLGTNDGKVA